MSRVKAHYLLCIVAGAVLPLAFAPFEQFWLAPLSYAALLYAWRDATPRQALGLSFAFGCASFGIGTYWTYIAVRIIGGAPVPLALFLTVGLTAVLAAFIAAAGWVAASGFRRTGAVAWLATLPALFVLTEWLRGWLFSGFGWLAAGYSQTDSWLMGYAPLAGIHAMSAAVLVSAGALLTLWLGTKRERAVAAAVVAAVWLGGFAARDRAFTVPKEGTLDVALATGAVPQELKWEPEQLRPTLTAYAELTNQGAGADLIIWPEAAIPIPIEFVSEYLETMRRRAAENGSTLLLGILRTVPLEDKTETYQNILLALTDEPQIYVKRHLVPFGEYFPVPSFIRSWMRLMNLPYQDLDRRRRRAAAGRSGRREARHHDLLRGRVRRGATALPSRQHAARQRQQRWLVRRVDRDTAASANRARAGCGGGALLAARGEPGHHRRHRSARPRRRDDSRVQTRRAAGDRARLYGQHAVCARRQLSGRGARARRAGRGLRRGSRAIPLLGERALDGVRRGFGASLLSNDGGNRGRALAVARVAEQRAEIARHALGPILGGEYGARHAELANAPRVVELIVAVRHEQRRPAAAQRLRRRAGAALMDDGARARKEQLMRRPVDEQHVSRHGRRGGSARSRRSTARRARRAWPRRPRSRGRTARPRRRPRCRA